MPERVSLARKIIKVFAFIGLVTFLVSLLLLLLARLRLGSGEELKQLAGTDFFEKFGLWLAMGSLLFALAGFKTAAGIKFARRWARPAALVMAVILVGLIPLGTIFGLKLLFDLFSGEVKDWFRTSGQISSAGPGQVPEYRGPDLDLIQQLEEQILKRKK